MPYNYDYAPSSPQPYKINSNVNGQINPNVGPYDTAGQQQKPDGYDASWGKYAQTGVAAGGVAASQIAQQEAIVNQANAVQGGMPGQQLDAYGRPIYNLSGLTYAANNNFKPSHAADTKERFKNTLSGAQEGAAAGSSAGPWGMAIGGITGSIFGGFGTHAAQKHRNKIIDRKQAIARANLKMAQNNYGSLVQNYNNKQMGQEDYQRISGNQNRLQNLWEVQSGNQPNG